MKNDVVHSYNTGASNSLRGALTNPLQSMPTICPPCVQQGNNLDGIMGPSWRAVMEGRHGGVQLGACEEVCSVMFLCVTKECCVLFIVGAAVCSS